ncbi:MAG: copper resistance protein CopC [Ruegeria sp.]|uniref:copper resistance CopC family protein n=1 Tax=Ruegeria sp. TaxID=1879320 RepID=UPI00349EE1C6
MKQVLIAALMVLIAMPALAHSVIKQSAPADGDVLAEMPSQVVLTFTKKIRLTRVELTLGDSGTSLDLSEHKGFGTEFMLPVDVSGTGLFQVDWRGLGEDGHVMQGEFGFEVK